MSQRNVHGRALLYMRDSGGKHEMTPGQYVEWAQRRAKELGVEFRPRSADIVEMITNGDCVRGDLFLDYDVSGHELTRPGLDALFSRAESDSFVSHLFVPRRDRLARPNDPLDGMKIENRLRTAGLTLVFTDRTVEPLVTGERPEIGELLTAVIDYHSAGEFRTDLSRKMVHCQIALARGGYSTGGRPPFGFDRWLVRSDGTKERQLKPGERVRMAGHHVVWLPATDERLDVALRIRQLLGEMPATQVARVLNKEGVPSPDAGRVRTDGGVRHRVSGYWHATTIVNIGRNPLWAAVTRYGLRSMGEQTRTSPDGPRALSEHDRRPDGKPKVIRNSADIQIRVDAHFDPVVSRDEHDELQAILDARSTSQRGKPRSRDPKCNPLGGRVYDMDCTWPMYRVKKGESFEYKCGQYQQTHGQRCNHNRVNGLAATKVVMSCIRQMVCRPSALPRLRGKLLSLAAAERSNSGSSPQDAEIHEVRNQLADVEEKLSLVQRNLAYAESKVLFEAVSSELERLRKQHEALQERLHAAEQTKVPDLSVGEVVDAAMERLEAMVQPVEPNDGLATATHLIRETNARLFVGFKRVPQGKRTLNKPAGGVVVLGDAPDPIDTYTGPTSPEKLKTKLSGGSSCCGGERISADSEPDGSQSLRNVSRDDRI